MAATDQQQPPTSRSEDKLQKFFGIPQGQYRVLSPTSPENISPVSPITNGNGNANHTVDRFTSELERPETRQSTVSVESSEHGRGKGEQIFAGNRMGSVKKRLSLLGIGKKPSKSSVRSRGHVESLIEE